MSKKYFEIDCDEAYPVYDAYERDEKTEYTVEFTEKEVRWMERVMKEYRELQDFLMRKM